MWRFLLACAERILVPFSTHAAFEESPRSQEDELDILSVNPLCLCDSVVFAADAVGQGDAFES